jgi:hypothetical protein
MPASPRPVLERRSHALGRGLTVGAWWAPRAPTAGDQDNGGRRLAQKARVGQDVNMAGRDQTVINYRRDE